MSLITLGILALTSQSALAAAPRAKRAPAARSIATAAQSASDAEALSLAPLAPTPPDPLFKYLPELSKAVDAYCETGDDTWTALQTILRKAAVQRAQQLVREAELPMNEGELDRLARLVATQVESLAPGAPPSCTAETEDEAWAMVKSVTTRAFAEKSLDAWLDLPPPRPRPTATEAPLLPLGATSIGQSGLRLDDKGIKLSEDLGGAGSQNGRVEPGEWITVELPLKNEGSLPWVSASARWSTPNSRLFIANPGEFKLGELPVGADTVVDVLVFVPADLPEQSLSLELQVQDTHRAPQAPAILNVKIPVHPYPESKLVHLGVDMDEIGQSAGGEKGAPVGAGAQVELYTAGEFAPLGKVTASETWVASARSKTIIRKANTPNQAKMVVTTAPDRTRVTMGDDADLWFTDQGDAFAAAANQLAETFNWTTAEEAGLPFRVDIEISEGAAPNTGGPVYTPSAQELRTLVRRHLTLQPVLGAPKGAEDARITDFGLTLDDGFDLELCRLQHPQQASACDKEVAEVPLLRVHHYVWLPIEWSPAPPPSVEEATEPEPAVARDSEGRAPRRASDSEHLLALSTFGSHLGVAEVGALSSVPMNGVGLGLRVGRRTFFTVDGASTTSPTPLVVAGTSKPTRLQGAWVTLGGGYAGRVNDRVELQADLGLQVTLAALEGGVTETTAIPHAQARVGVSLYPTSWLSFDLLAGSFLAVGEAYLPRGGVPIAIEGPTFRGGLSVHFR